MLTEWEKWKQSLGETRPWHLLDESAKLSDPEKIKERLDICKSCPELIQLTKQCKQCGCVMTLKTKLIQATCPLNKW